MKALLLSVLVVGAAAAGQPKDRTFTGTITDEMCATGDHSHMRMGPTDGECTNACVIAHGAEYVLSAGKDVYRLSDQKAPEEFAGQRVAVVGTLDPRTKTIRVESIAAAR